MDSDQADPGRRARRALPLIGAALIAIVLAGLLYLRSSAPPAATPPAAGIPSTAILDPRYDATYDFVTPSIGWALVTESNHRSNQLAVFSTLDGAKHWSNEFTAPMPPGAATLRFFDAAHGLISILSDPSFAYVSADGGHTWKIVSLPRSVVTLDFADPAHGWVETWLGTIGFGFRLFSSADGGQSWIERTWPAGAGWGSRARFGIDIQLRSKGEGWMGGYNTFPVAYVTHDDGLTWQAVPIELPAGAFPAPPAGAGEAYQSYNTEMALLPGGAAIAAVFDHYGHVRDFLSTDGRIWRPLGEPVTGLQYSDYMFVDSTHWWALRSGMVFRTADAGLTWSRRRSANLTDGWNYEPHLIDARHAWAVSRWAGTATVGTALTMTSDGGLTWQAANVPNPA